MRATDHRSTGWTILAAFATFSTFLLVILGGIVRITESGMGCGDDWPLCNGSLIPPLDLPTFIEYGHRLTALAVTVLVVGLAATAWKPGRKQGWRRRRRSSLLALGLLGVQILLGAITVWLELPPTSVILHLGTAMAVFAALVVATLQGMRAGEGGHPAEDRASSMVVAFGGLALIVVVLGALVANLEAATACVGFPLCNGELFPVNAWRVQLHWTHRMLAYALALSLLGLPYATRLHRPGDGPALRAAWLSLAVGWVQIAIAAAMVLQLFPPGLRAVHVGAGAAVFGALVIYAWLVRHPAAWVPSPPAVGASSTTVDSAAAGRRHVSG